MAREFPEFIIEYEYNGETWCMTVCAESYDDCRARLLAASKGEILGELQQVVSYRLGWYAKLVCWWKNRRRDK